MKKIKYLLIGNLALVALLAGCASSPEEPIAPHTEPKFAPSASIEAKQVAAQEETTHVAEINFGKASTELSPAGKAEIKKRIKEAQGKGTVKNIRVLTWADAEYPSVHTKKLSKEDQNLVKKRNESIENYLKSITQKVDIKLYSMAQRPSSLNDMFGSEEGRLKKSLEIAGIPNSDSSVKNPSKASKSIVIIELK
ncbi:MAG: hypothetical protein H7061_03320 [Bdellovibrionaceae bacterium]|nr:hypothetical protein [Bdellovibrio sp.]